MKLRRTLAGLAVTVAALTSLGVAATPANASDSWTLILSTTDDNPGGRMWWAQNGDVVQGCDVQADGKGTQTSVYNDDGSLYYRFEANTSGTCVTRRASMGSEYDLTEGYQYKLEICLTTGTYHTPEFCRSAWVWA